MSRLRLLSAFAVLAVSLTSVPCYAVNKDMIQLQTQVQQLQDAVARLQQANDERMGVLKDLVQQTSDNVNKMSVAVDGMKLQLQNEGTASGAKNDQLSGQIQSLNDSIDELKARMARMEKGISDISNQQQTIGAALNNAQQPTGGGAPVTTAPPSSNDAAPTDAAPQTGLPPTSDVIAPPAGTMTNAPAAGAPPIADMYRSAYGDFVSGKYPLAMQEFQELTKAYPDDNLSGNAWFYMGEIDLRTQKPTAAVSAYNRLIERYPDNVKIPAAHLHKADAMIAMRQSDKAALELRALIQRFPNSPEATAARTKLNAIGAHR
jgi:tol-pal system protein YbgF